MLCHLFISLRDELNLKVAFVQPVRAVTTLGSGHLLVLDDVFLDYRSSRFQEIDPFLLIRKRKSRKPRWSFHLPKC
jgi:hypothetical protein